MDLKKILGEAYKDDMTFEEVQKALADKELIEKSEMKGYVKKDLMDKAASDAAEYKRQLKAKMTEDEQKEAERIAAQEAIEKELAELKHKNAVTENEKRFLALGYDAKLASETANALADGNLDVVFQNQEKFISLREKDIRAGVLKEMKDPPAGNGQRANVALEDFKKMNYSERNDLFVKDKEMYNTLINQEQGG